MTQGVEGSSERDDDDKIGVSGREELFEEEGKINELLLLLFSGIEVEELFFESLAVKLLLVSLLLFSRLFAKLLKESFLLKFKTFENSFTENKESKL